MFPFTHHNPGDYVLSVKLCWRLNSSVNKQNSLLLSLFNTVLRMKIFQLLNCCMPITTHTQHARKDFSNNSLLNCSTIQVQKKVFTLVGLVSANSPRSFRWTIKIIRVIFKPNQGSFFSFRCK